MYTLRNLFSAITGAFLPESPSEREERYLAGAVDHADLEYRLASMARSYLALYPAGTGR